MCNPVCICPIRIDQCLTLSPQVTGLSRMRETCKHITTHFLPSFLLSLYSSLRLADRCLLRLADHLPLASVSQWETPVFACHDSKSLVCDFDHTLANTPHQISTHSYQWCCFCVVELIAPLHVSSHVSKIHDQPLRGDDTCPTHATLGHQPPPILLLVTAQMVNDALLVCAVALPAR